MLRGRRNRGFTLFELMVAIAIFAVLGVMTWTAMAGMMRQQELTTESMDRFRQVQQGITLLTRDLEHVRPRPVRGASHGDFQPALGGGGFLDMPLEFTRGGVRNPRELPRSSLQRVGYRVENGSLIRYRWPVLDRAPDTLPLRQPLIDDVVGMEIRFLAPDGEWSEQWPPAQVDPAANPFIMPRAVDIYLEIEGYGEIRRLLDIPGVTGEDPE